MTVMCSTPLDITIARMVRDCGRHTGLARYTLIALLLAVLEVVSINLNILLFVRRNRTLLEDGTHGAGRLTGAAVNALIRINEELLDVLIVTFTLRGMNAIYRTDVHTGTVFKTHAWAGNHVRHGTNNLLIRNSREDLGNISGPAHERDTLAAVSALIIPISGINCYLLAKPHWFQAWSGE
jgi:hypothetical protein